MSFLFYTVALNLLVLAVSANHSVPIETSRLTSDFKPPTAPKVYNSCGSACPPTCAKPEPQFCILLCKADWFCPKDYFLNSAGNCVLREYCDNVQPTPDPVPLPQPFPTYPFPRPLPRPFPRPLPRPFPRPLPRPFPRPFPVSLPKPFVQNLTEVSDDFGRFPEWPDLQSFEPVESPQIAFSLYPSLPKPSYQISPINHNASDVANGAPRPPPAVVRTTGSNAPYIPSPPMVPKIKPLIDFDPTVTRPVLRVSKEQTSKDEK